MIKDDDLRLLMSGVEVYVTFRSSERKSGIDGISVFAAELTGSKVMVQTDPKDESRSVLDIRDIISVDRVL